MVKDEFLQQEQFDSGGNIPDGAHLKKLFEIVWFLHFPIFRCGCAGRRSQFDSPGRLASKISRKLSRRV